MNIQFKKHVDGHWLTSYTEYKGRTLILKAKKDHGMKIHCQMNDKIQWTLRYSFISPVELIKRAQKRIDDQIKHEEKCIKEQ